MAHKTGYEVTTQSSHGTRTTWHRSIARAWDRVKSPVADSSVLRQVSTGAAIEMAVMLGIAITMAARAAQYEVDRCVRLLGRALASLSPEKLILSGCGLDLDEHRGFDERGDFRRSRIVSYVSADKATGAPYHDSGGLGLALVRVVRERWYSKAHHTMYGWHPSTATEMYLCGRNEAGTFFAHRVPTHCGTVLGALEWIWGGRHLDIIQRQGDIALIRGRGPKMPARLPDSHMVAEKTLPDGTVATLGVVTHPTHPSLPLPGRGERIIVGRRAKARGDGAGSQTRD